MALSFTGSGRCFAGAGVAAAARCEACAGGCAARLRRRGRRTAPPAVRPRPSAPHSVRCAASAAAAENTTSTCGFGERRVPPLPPPLLPPAGFEVLWRSRCSAARSGRILTAHGAVETPAFVPVATSATLKYVDPRTAAALLPARTLTFCNTFHLIVHPGVATVAAAGGLHAFMGCDRPLITDSGGFQAFSFGDREGLEAVGGLKGVARKRNAGCLEHVSDAGLRFRSYWDGTLVELTPESCVAAQKALGADIILPLDQLLRDDATPAQRDVAFGRTLAWEEASLAAHRADPRGQQMWGIVHGDADLARRAECTRRLFALPFDGFCIGGSLGRSTEEMLGIVEAVMRARPPGDERPVHLLGIGRIEQIEAAVRLGVDSFDSSYVTRAGRHGTLLVGDGEVLNLGAAEHRNLHGPVDPRCACWACRHYSRAYLHHLHKQREPAGMALGTLHNLTWMATRMRLLRQRIAQGVL